MLVRRERWEELTRYEIKKKQAFGPQAMLAAACFFVAAFLSDNPLLGAAGLLWFNLGITALVRSRLDNRPHN